MMNFMINAFDSPQQQGLLTLHGRLYTEQQSTALLANLIRGLDWQTHFVAYGRRFDIPRQQAWYADEGVHYRYSENQMPSQRWVEPLISIKNRVEDIASRSFNSVLVTYYRDGQDHVGWHADDEPELGDSPSIASLSLGQSRQFHFRPKDMGESGYIELHDGELVIMQAGFQQQWQHCVPSQDEIYKPRINLTFRQVVMSRQEGVDSMILDTESPSCN